MHDEEKGRLAILLTEISQLDGADEIRDWYLGLRIGSGSSIINLNRRPSNLVEDIERRG